MRRLAIITGAGGWLGRALVRALRRGIPEASAVAVPPRRPLALLAHTEDEQRCLAELAPDARIVVGDVTLRASLAPLFADAEDATVFHCAGLIHPKRIRDLYLVNEGGTRNVLQCAREAGVRRFLHVSSNSPLGCNAGPAERFDERTPYRPYLNYGMSKKLAEDAVNEAHREHGLPTTIVRPPWFYGPGQPARQREFLSMIKRGRFPLIGDGSNRRSMAYVDNICLGLLLAEESEIANGQTYWIADKDPYSMREIVNTIADVLAEDFSLEVVRRTISLPNLASTVAYTIDSALQASGCYYTKVHVLSEMNKTIACSIAKAEVELGYRPPFSLREGMRRSVQSLLEDGFKI